MTTQPRKPGKPFVFGASSPGPKRGPMVRLVKPRCTVVVISHNTIGHDTHWLITDRGTKPPTGRTVPCTRHQGECIHCLRRTDSSTAPKWKGWLTVSPGGAGGIAMLEVVQRHVDLDERLHTDWPGSLRGTQILYSRDGLLPSSPTNVELSETPLPNWVGPQDIDRVAWLCALWGFGTRAQGNWTVSDGEHLLKPFIPWDESEVPNPPPVLDESSSAG